MYDDVLLPCLSHFGLKASAKCLNCKLYVYPDKYRPSLPPTSSTQPSYRLAVPPSSPIHPLSCSTQAVQNVPRPFRLPNYFLLSFFPQTGATHRLLTNHAVRNWSEKLLSWLAEPRRANSFQYTCSDLSVLNMFCWFVSFLLGFPLQSSLTHWLTDFPSQLISERNPLGYLSSRWNCLLL